LGKFINTIKKPLKLAGFLFGCQLGGFCFKQGRADKDTSAGKLHKGYQLRYGLKLSCPFGRVHSLKLNK
jgi:hypothetical protein